MLTGLDLSDKEKMDDEENLQTLTCSKKRTNGTTRQTWKLMAIE
jgi:hypothetical protein